MLFVLLKALQVQLLQHKGMLCKITGQSLMKTDVCRASARPDKLRSSS
jgi:hypothetical protein